jgi:hypothetical protein
MHPGRASLAAAASVPGTLIFQRINSDAKLGHAMQPHDGAPPGGSSDLPKIRLGC